MSIPYIHVPLANKGLLNGIIFKLKQTLSDDIIISDYVTPSSIGDQIGQKNELVTWSDMEYQAGPGSVSKLPWIQLTFPNHYMYPTAYSMRSVKNNHCIATSWHIYGIYEGDENNEKNWELLGVNDTSESTYCKTLNSAKRCDDDSVGTFTLKRMPTNRGYKHMRWRSRNGSECNSAFYFATSGIDIYGTLSQKSVMKNKNACTCRIRVPIYKLVITSLYANCMIS